MDLDIFAGLPAYTLEAGGRSWKFTEIDMAGLAELQAWLRASVPNPLEAVKPLLSGLEPAERAGLLENARREALDWPPRIGTPAGALALFGSEEAQVLILRLALRTHHPELTAEQAGRLFRWLKAQDAAWDRAEAQRVRAEGGTPREYPVNARIIATAFGMPSPDDEEELKGFSGPKAPGPASGPSTS